MAYHDSQNYERLDENEFVTTIIDKFSEAHVYNLDDYNCNEYSRDLNYVLTNLGYETYTHSGHNITDGHRWISIAIEPTIGNFYNNRKKYPVMYNDSEKS